MRIITVGELKTHFSEVIRDLKAGEEIAVAFGKKREIVAYLIPKAARVPARRELGILQAKGTATFSQNFKITVDEFLRL